MIELNHIDVHQVFHNLSGTLQTGCITAILGANGSGKTVLTQLSCALHAPDSGTIRILGNPSECPESIRIIRKKIGCLFQNPEDQIVGTTVEEDLRFGLENLGMDSPSIDQQVHQALEAFELQDLQSTPPHLLSGGEKQRLAMASVWIMQPEIILADDAFCMLDPVTRDRLWKRLVAAVHSRSGTLIYNTTSLSQALEADQLMLIEGGQLHRYEHPWDFVKQLEGELSLEQQTLHIRGFDIPPILGVVLAMRSRGIKIPLPDKATGNSWPDILGQTLAEHVRQALGGLSHD